jgi:hypothetical protein
MRIRILPLTFSRLGPSNAPEAQASTFHFDADQDPAVHFDADPDPAFHFDKDPDPATENDADPDPQHCTPSCTMYEDLVVIGSRIRIRKAATLYLMIESC